MDRPVIIAEDELVTRSLMVALVQKAGFQTRVADDAEACLELLETVVPAAFLLDYHLPGLDGFQAAMLIRANPATADVPILFVTAWVDQAFVEKVSLLSRTFILSKPFMPDAFLNRFQQILALRTAV